MNNQKSSITENCKRLLKSKKKLFEHSLRQIKFLKDQLGKESSITQVKDIKIELNEIETLSPFHVEKKIKSFEEKMNQVSLLIQLSHFNSNKKL